MTGLGRESRRGELCEPHSFPTRASRNSALQKRRFKESRLQRHAHQPEPSDGTGILPVGLDRLKACRSALRPRWLMGRERGRMDHGTPAEPKRPGLIGTPQARGPTGLRVRIPRKSSRIDPSHRRDNFVLQRQHPFVPASSSRFAKGPLEQGRGPWHGADAKAAFQTSKVFHGGAENRARGKRALHSISSELKQ